MTRVASEGTLAVIHCAEPFTLAPGHRLRAAHCVICRQLIGGQAATVVGVAGLAGEACRCGQIGSDVFLLHAIHLPISSGRLADSIYRAMRCTADHC